MSEKDFTIMHSRNMQQVSVTQRITKVLTLEYDSVAAIARSTGLPFRDVYRSIELELSGKNEKGEETT